MQTLLSVMEQGDPLAYIERLNIRTDAVIVNQCGREGEYTRQTDSSGREVTVRVAERDEKGLSRSRNLAISMASDDICILCDNDIRYEDDASEVIVQAFLRHPDAGIICFFIERPERKSPVKDREGEMSKKDMMRIFSPEIALRTSKLGDLRFSEDFGAGAKYSMGEENIFLFEAKRRGIECIYVPEKIANTLPNESSWFGGYDEKFFRDRGAGYEAMDRGLWHILCWQFLLRKRSLYRETISAAAAWRAMKEGRAEYRREALSGEEQGKRG